MVKVLRLLLVASLMLSGIAVAAQEDVTITVRCAANIAGGEGWRCDNFAAVEEQVEQELGINITLNLIQDNKAWADYKTEFVLAAEAGEAPDIVLSGHEDIGAWAAAGLIMPLDELIAQHEEFADVVPNLWASQTYDGVIYGIPQDAEARPIFYSKLLLADLGWSDEEIESLPERVRTGEFTFEDMLATAEEAVAEGVVEPGKGYFHRWGNGFDWLPYYLGNGGEIMTEDGQLVFDQDAALAAYELIGSFVKRGVTPETMIGTESSAIYAEFAPADNVMFYQGGTWQWADWARNYVADLGGNDYLLENVGLMLFPAMNDGVPLSLTHPLSYMISSGSEHPDVAIALLAAVTTPDANNRHAIDSFHLGILTTQVESEAYAADPVLSGAHYMLDYTRFAPNTPFYSAWSNAYWAGIQAAHTGTPAEEAVELAVTQLQNELGDQIVIR
ncbi:MAG: extracellular solute-binding protein [Chloroflexi bacterium]|nr:extracellular solute-binding protein [Chloroflexota bacterium]